MCIFITFDISLACVFQCLLHIFAIDWLYACPCWFFGVCFVFKTIDYFVGNERRKLTQLKENTLMHIINY